LSKLPAHPTPSSKLVCFDKKYKGTCVKQNCKFCPKVEKTGELSPAVDVKVDKKSSLEAPHHAPALHGEALKIKLGEDRDDAVITAHSDFLKSSLVHSGSGYTKVGELVQRVQRFSTNIFLSLSTQKILSVVYPYVKFVPSLSTEARFHPHPILNIDREIAEDIAYNYCKTLMDDIKYSGVIVDIGGNIDRHIRKKRTIIHSCNPILDSADVIRSVNHPLAKNNCRHRAEDCNCVQLPGVYMSIDSLYYLDEDTIATLCLKSTTKSLVAVCHEFPDAYGSFANGEATYQHTSLDTISMTVKGNSHAYSHSNLSWMRNNSYAISSNGHRIGTLCWSKVSSTPYHSIYIFHFTSLVVESSLPTEVTFSSAMLDPGHYGPVSMSALNEKAVVNVGGSQLSLPDVKVWSWGKFVVVTKSGNKISMMCPKGFVSECAVRCAGQVRSPDNFRNLVAWAKFKASSYNIPAHMLSTCLFAVCNLAFVQDLHFETAVMHGLIEPALGVISVHENALSRKFSTVWTVAKVAGVVAAAVTSSSLIGKALTVAGVSTAVATGAVLAAAGVAVAAAAVAKLMFRSSADPFADYRSDRKSNPPRTGVVFLPRGIQLPATDPVKSLDVLLNPILTPLDLTSKAKLVVQDPLGNREPENAPPIRPGPASMPLSLVMERTGGGLYKGLRDVTWHNTMPLMPCGIVSDLCIPIVPSNSAHSDLSAVTERILKCGPKGKGLLDLEFWGLFRKWVFDNLDEMGLQQGCNRRMSFDDWNAKYAPSQQKIHVKARFDVVRDDSFLPDKVHSRGMFTKIESLTKSTIEGVAKLAPRGIQSGTPIHNVVTGPTCLSFSKRLMHVWDVKSSNGGLMYTSGASAEDIGDAFLRAREFCPAYSILEGDFARFDSTIHRYFLELEAEIYRYTGCSEREYNAFMACIFTRGKSKWGVKYEIDGGRHSGDHNTSCGNSLLQGLAIFFCMSFHHSCVNGGLLPHYKELVELYKITMLVLGDDNLMVACAKFLASFGPKAEILVALLLRLGLELEPKVHVGPTAKYHASFCSARFYPVAGGKCVLAPGIGRGLAKSGWYVDSPINMPVERMVRGDAIGKAGDCWFVPFLGPMWKKNLELTKDFVGKEILSRDLQRNKKFSAHSLQKHDSCDETYEMVESLYGLTRADEEEYIGLLNTVKSLPSIVNLSKFHAAMVVDGVTDDVLQEVCCEHYSDMNEEKYPEVVQVGFIDATIARLASALQTNPPIDHSKGVYSILGADDEQDSHGLVSSVWDN
jgi:hypothetical protein